MIRRIGGAGGVGMRRWFTPLLLATTALVAVGAALLAFAGSAAAGSTTYPSSPPYPSGSGTVTFAPGSTPDTECYQTYTVPNRVTKLEVEAYGAEGADGMGETGLLTGHPTPVPSTLGGPGSEVDTVVNVTPGETLYVGPASEAFAGGAGGLAGMFSGDQPKTAAGEAGVPSAGGDGGNASFVSTEAPTGGAYGCSFTPSELNSVLVVAAGGGGGGGSGSDLAGGTGGSEASGFGGAVSAGPGQDGNWEVNWWQDTGVTIDNSDLPVDSGAGGTNATAVPADKTACPSIEPVNSNSTADVFQGGCSGNGGTGDSFMEPGFDPTGTGNDAGFAEMYCPAGEAGAVGVAQYGGDGGSGWQSPDADDMDVDVAVNPFVAEGNAQSDARALIKQSLQADPNPDSAIITEESMAAEEAESSLWLKSNPLDAVADTLEADIGADALLAGISFLSDFENALFPSIPLYSVIGCGGEDAPAPAGTTANAYTPGSSVGGGGGGGGGWYGGGGGGSADDYLDAAGGGGGGAGASYIAGQSYSQTLTRTSASQLSAAQVTLNPVETPPTIVDPSTGCVYGTSSCATGPTFTCVIEGACSDTIQTAGYVLPWVSQTSGSTLPSGFGFAETVVGTEQYDAGLQQYPGVGWSTAHPPATFTFEAPWNLYSPGSQNIPSQATLCALTGPEGSQQSYNNALEATNFDGLGTYVLPTTTIDYSPGSLLSAAAFVDPNSESLVDDQSVFPGGVPIKLDATADFSSGCDYSVANDSAAHWSVTGSSAPGVGAVSDTSVVTLSSGSGAELVQPVGPGTATVNFSYTTGGVTKTASYTITVQEGVPSSIWIARTSLADPLDSACVPGGSALSSLAVVPGDQGQLYVCANYGNGLVEDVTNSVTWATGSGLSQTGLALGNALGPQLGEFVVQAPGDGSIAQASFSGTVTATLIAYGGGASGIATPTPVVASLPVTINWANPTSLSVTGGVGPGQDVQGGQGLQLSATATYDNGTTVDVSKLASWSSNNSNVAQSDGNGVIQIPYFENGGFASITATLGGQSGAEELTVDSSIPPTITLKDANGNTGSGTVGLGQTDQLTAADFTGGAPNQILNPLVTWATNEPGVATVSSSGLVTVVGGSQGEQATIRATDGLFSGTFVVTVDLTHPTSITVTPGTATMGSGGSLTFTATGHYPGGYTANVSSFATWSTNKPSSTTDFNLYQLSVAPNSTGNPIVIAVQASLGGAVPGTATVTEGVGPPTSLTVSPATSGSGGTPLSPGQTVQMSATAQFGSGSGAANVDVTNNVTWISSNTSVVTVSQTGLVTAVGHTNNAEASVYATYTDNNVTLATEVAADYIITLTDPTSIAVTAPQTTPLLAGQVEYLTATGTYPDGSTANITNYVTWSSTCPSQACNVSAGGATEAAGAQAADPTITATAGNGVFGSTSVEVAGPVAISAPSSSTSTITVGVPYTSPTFTTTGGSGSYSWSLSGPGDFSQSGLSLSANTGSSVQITGTPTAQLWQELGTNRFYLELTATDSNNPSGGQGSSVMILIPVKLAQLPQTVSWTSTLPATVQPGAAINLSQFAATTSGLGVSYSVSDTDGGHLCSVQGSQLTFSQGATGTCSITGTAATSAEYAPAPSTVTDTVQVVAPLTNSWSVQAPAVVQAGVGCGPSLSQLSGCSSQAANGLPASWVTAWGNYQWSGSQGSGTLQGPIATLSVDSSTTGYGTPGQVCTITGTSQVNWLLPGTCVLDANNAGGNFDGNLFTAPPQIQSTTQIIGYVGSLSFSSSVPVAARVGATYTPSFTAIPPDGSNVGVVAGRPDTSPSPATPQVTIDQAHTSPSGACTTNGTTVTFAHIGTCVINAFQPVSGVYGRANASSEQTIQITQAPQTIGFGAEASKSYIPGDTVTLTPSPGGSGNPVTVTVDPSSTSSCTMNAQHQVSLPNAGTCVIDAAEAAGGDYLATTAKETLTVQSVHLALVSGLPCTPNYGLLTCVSTGQSAPALQAPASPGADLLMYVVLENGANQPVVPDYSIPVTLASATVGSGSDPQFLAGGQFSNRATIAAGSPAAMVIYGDQAAGTRNVSASGQIAGSNPTITSSPVPVTVAPGTVASLSWIDQPPDGVAGSTLGQFAVEAFDQYGNPVPGVQVSLTGTNGAGNAATIDQGASATTNASGVANFQSTEINAAGTYSLTAATDGGAISTPISSSFSVNTGAPQSLSISGGPTGGPLAAGGTLPEVQVEVLDGSSNPLPDVPVRLTTRENGATVTLASGTTGADGSAATFSSLVIPTPGAYTITAADADDSGIDGTLGPFTVSPVTTGLSDTYVSASGSDSRACVQATPCATVTGAESELGPSGGTVHVSGTIDESAIDVGVPGISIVGVPGTGATINGQSSGSPIFTVDGSIGAGQNVTISGLTLTDGSSGSGGNGGAIMDESEGTVTVTADVFTSDSADSGGGAIYTAGSGSLLVSDSTFSSDSAGTIGGAIDATAGGGITLLGSTFARNTALMIASAVDSGSGNDDYAGNLFDGTCAGSGDLFDDGYNALSDSSCSPNGGTGDATSSFGADEFTGSATAGTLTPTYNNPASDLIPQGTAVTLGNDNTVDLCAASEALLTPHTIQTPGGSEQVCNAGSSQTGATSVPHPPTGVALTGNPDGSLSVGWVAPTDDGALALTGYTVTLYDASGSIAGTKTVAPTVTSSNFSGLAAGSYTARVSASNADGPSPESFVSLPTAVGAAGVPAQLSFVSDPGSATAGQALAPFQVEVEDSQGQPLTGVTVGLTAVPMEGTLDPPIVSDGSAISDGSGNATFAGTTINASGSYTLLASVESGGSAITDSSAQFTVAADSPTQVQFSQEPADGVIGAALPEYSVTVLDQYGNPVPNADVVVTDAGGHQVDQNSTDGAGDPLAFGLTTITDPTEMGSTTLTATVAGTQVTGTSAAFVLGPDLDAPTDVSATNSDGVADVTWTAPADPSGLITGYSVDAYTADGTLLGSGTAAGTSDAFSGVTGDDIFTVTANTQFGITGAVSAPSAAVLIGKAGVPARVQFTQSFATAEAGEPLPTAQVTVTDAFGNAVPNAPVTFSGGGGVFQNGTADSEGVATLTGAEVDEVGTYRITADSSGQASGGTYDVSAQSAPYTVDGGTPTHIETGWTPTNVAGQPLTDVSVEVTDQFGQQDLGQPVTLSVIDTSTGVAPAGWQNVTADVIDNGRGETAAFFHDITVDSAGTYDLVATAGSISNSEQFTLESPPGAPTAVTATANDDGTATVSWSVPTDGGLPIQGYTITPYNSDGHALAQTTVNPETSARISGLQPGGTYTFTVAASNDDGLGTESSPSAAATIPAIPPNAPSIVQAVAGPSGVSVRWDPPTDDGDSPLTAVKVNAYDADDNLVESQLADLSNGAVQFTDLSVGSFYTFTAVATNAGGDSPASPASAPLLVTGPPAEFTSADSVSATSSAPGTALVTWAPPDNDEGALANQSTSYTVTATDVTNAANGGQSVTTADGSAQTARFTGLTDGDQYYFTISVTTLAGDGNTNGSGFVWILGAPPGAPASVNAVVQNAQSAYVYWSPPATGAVIPATSYTVLAVDTTNPANGGQSATTSGSALNTTITGLTGGDNYVFSVTANNTYGSGPTVTMPQADAVTAFAAPSAPRFTSAAANPDGSVTVNWTPPTSTGGAPVVGYMVSVVDQTNSSGSLGAFPAPAGTTSLVIPGLGGGDTYVFSVQANTTFGYGAQSSFSTGVQTPSFALAPTSANAVLNSDGTVTVNWTAGADPSITGYVITANDYTNFDPNPADTPTVTVGSTATTASFNKLNLGDEYVFTVTPVNGVGQSPNTLDTEPVTVAITTPTGGGTGTTTTTGGGTTTTTGGGTTTTLGGSTGTTATAGGSGTSQPATPAAASTSLTITDATRTAVYGKAITVSGKLTAGGAGLPGEPVTLLYRLKGSGGSFQQFRTLDTTNAKGVVTFTTFKPTTPVDVELRFGGNVSYLTTTSEVAHVAEGLEITLKASAQKLKPKRTVTFTGAVEPAGADRHVELQVLKGKNWVKVAAAKLTGSGRYTLKLKPGNAGKFSYRILADGIAPYTASMSNTVHIAVS
jgi:predicted RNA-binding protein with TRAM domain